MNIIRQDKATSIAVIENTDSSESKRFYVAAWDESKGQCRSVVPADCPSQRGCQWMARTTLSGLQYVANPRTRGTAQRWFRKLVTDEEHPG